MKERWAQVQTTSRELELSCPSAPQMLPGISSFSPDAHNGVFFFSSHSSKGQEPLCVLFPCSDCHPLVPLPGGGDLLSKSRGRLNDHALRKAPGDFAGQSSTPEAPPVPAIGLLSYGSQHSELTLFIRLLSAFLFSLEHQLLKNRDNTARAHCCIPRTQNRVW